MNATVFVTFWLIVLARITDVTLDTIRTVAVVLAQAPEPPSKEAFRNLLQET